MKKIVLYLLPLIGLLLASCTGRTYAKQLEEERDLIKSFIKREGINVITELPKEGKWGEKDYYLVKGLDYFYFHLDSIGDTTYEVKSGNRIVIRYLRYTLTVPADTANTLTTNEQAFPTEFIYGQIDGNSCAGWQHAVKYMKHSGASCKIICPSKLDFDNSNVTPYGYDLKIKFMPY